MNPLQDATPRPPKYADLEASVILPKQRASPASSLTSLPYRRSNPSLHKLFESTSSLAGSRPSSGTATPTPASAPPAALSPGSRQNGTGTPSSLQPGVSDEYRILIQRAFVPHVAVVADVETETMIRGKGIEGGLLQLLRPFGETVPGKITIRDSIGASKSHADFGIRFVGAHLGSGLASLPATARNSLEDPSRTSHTSMRPRSIGGNVAQVEEVVDRHLQYFEFNAHTAASGIPGEPHTLAPEANSSPFYTLYLRRLLSGLPLVPHETFAHPVASVIAVSSRNPNPTEEFRRLYAKQREGELRPPPWVDNEYLRYYVLVHEEETGDIAKSNQVFDQMKRHFGLNCHLLRLKSQQCIPSDDDSVRLPTCEWMSSAEELAEIQQRETADDITDPTPYIPESDITAIRTFVRELVAQSIVPQMERHVATWNEQVLARRRGISGRFMSLSKRWTPFGSSRNSSSPALGSSNTNYDSLQGFYRPDAPEAIMRKLADYSFMLRDWKLALSTYDILRTDFNNDKAWRHYAGAAEMAALSALMSTGPLTSKTRTENIDTWIEAASYSYTDRDRSAAPYYALRTLALSLELLRLRGASAADDAARWASRILEMGLVGPVGNALFTERVAACYAIRKGVGAHRMGSRLRKAAFFAVLAAEAWFRLGKSLQAEKCLDVAMGLYGARGGYDDGVVKIPFAQMREFIEELRQQILGLRMSIRGLESEEGAEEEVEESVVVEETETLDKSPRMHRRSLIGAVAPATDLAGLTPGLEREREEEKKADHFE
ncbi:uncharacterized protein EI97DRAFT_192921 [Westerdykella ornata]|uniref:ER-golgi trafficking TRAPP I complex 85 kDa subunit-domain-containing protein n=1 Tax=Westerdykella ornata TaxID=318751 RepID=A0A6A6J9W8_WESOR|nr:uncharacterized protein EI97DRAFT_192921 [Westerdykella ornata]KAF2273024.1 hypothetical protein EI97DRAFT_192921 [Westerdykella ornata]